MWRYADFIKISDFLSIANRMNSATRERYPLLYTFIQHEERLSMIQHLVSILEWHRILFYVFQNNEITRDEARQLTNRDVLERIQDVSERKKACS